MSDRESSSTGLAENGRKTLNVSAYKFVRLSDLEQRKLNLRTKAISLELKGTILLSSEGINLFLAGTPAKVNEFFSWLHADPLFSDLEPKESYSASQPFRRMLVRLKKEIIAFGVDNIQPEKRTAPKVSARELKRWLDEKRELVLLDTRNDYEIELGTFRNAKDLNIHHFRSFPSALSQLPEELKHKTIVMFCTGGIRCEKAGPMMQTAGFQDVYQLDGGILKYFEEVGDSYWDGSCFVFDNRVALKPNLQPTGDQLCFVCQSILHPQDLDSPFYKLGHHCPKCYVSDEDREATHRASRMNTIRSIANSQPGSHPYDNQRNIFVSGKLAGKTVIDFLDAYQPFIGRSKWMQWLNKGEITFQGKVASPEQIVREGQHFVQHQPNFVEPHINPEIQIVHEDASLIVVNKPAPLPMHPCGRFNRNSLVWILEQAYIQQKLRVAHRLDANTSGLTVLCRKAQSARYVQPQFSEGTVKKTYLARVHGIPSWVETSCAVPIADHPSIGGSRLASATEGGLPSLTEFTLIQRLDDGTSLIEAKPKSGRTHQIRIHLWHLGFSILGDPLYLTGGAIGLNRTLDVSESPMCLHSQAITFAHPETKKLVTYTADVPIWGRLS